MVAGNWQYILLVGRIAKVAVCNGLIGQGNVVVFTTEAETLGWQLVDVGLCILLGGAVGLELAWNTIDRQVVVHQVEVASLDLVEQLVAGLANESIIVLAFNVDHELLVASLSALGEGHHSLESNGSLER